MRALPERVARNDRKTDDDGVRRPSHASEGGRECFHAIQVDLAQPLALEHHPVVVPPGQQVGCRLVDEDEQIGDAPAQVDVAQAPGLELTDVDVDGLR